LSIIESSDERRGEAHIVVSRETTQALQAAARGLRITLNSVLQGAWALLISRLSCRSDVAFGAAFSGRPENLNGAEDIVGPFVNNLPIRVQVDRGSSINGFLRGIHARSIELIPHQFMPLMEIQACSEVPWRHRLFESAVVFQNYSVDESARQFGSALRIDDFVAPIHTNYPVMLLAEPGDTLRLTLIYDPRKIEAATIENWGRNLAILLDRIPQSLGSNVSDLHALISAPAIPVAETKLKFRAQSAEYAAPKSETERAISSVWQEMFGLDRVSMEENLFDLGGHSLLIVQMHSRLVGVLKKDFPVVALFEYPTIRLLAAQLGNSENDKVEVGKESRERALRQKQALADLRGRMKRTGR
jgi:non-ribosomal peptide synthetase component F